MKKHFYFKKTVKKQRLIWFVTFFVWLKITFWRKLKVNLIEFITLTIALILQLFSLLIWLPLLLLFEMLLRLWYIIFGHKTRLRLSLKALEVGEVTTQ